MKGVAMEIPHTKDLGTIRRLFDSQDLSVLSTQKNGQPYASIVAVTVTPDLKQIIFLTPCTTRKYDNLVASPRVAMLINNSQNRAEDITNAISVTATGEAFEATGQEKKQMLSLYLKRHPHMKTFAGDPTTAVVRMAVAKYIMVSQFQNVVEIKVES
jgi:nitroimidazol reductase NimA-like FMN-containing flavoprotein (pyridoxamine 5'-phosphate oxidase superfamily)